MTMTVDPTRGCDVLIKWTPNSGIPSYRPTANYCRKETVVARGDYNYCEGHRFLYAMDKEGEPDAERTDDN